MDMKLVSLKELKPSAHNARQTFDDTKMKELIASVEEKGILNPILIRPSNGKYEIVCGERRFRAAAAAGMEEIPAVIRTLTDQQALECMVIENLQREDVHPLEEAEGYEKLLKNYKTVDELAVKVGKSKAYIYGRLKLCELVPENRKYFYEGKFTASVALLVARVPKNQQKEVGKEVATNREHYGDDRPMSFEEAKEYIQDEFMLQMKEAQWDPKEKGLANKGSCLECPKRTGASKELFADIQGADRCTDPRCFNAKKQTFTQRKLAQLKSEGKQVISQDEAEKIFRYDNDTPDSKYTALDEHDWSWPKEVTPRKMLKTCKDVKVIYAIQPTSGKIIEMVSRIDLPKLFKAAGIKTDKPVNTSEKISEHKKENRVDTARTAFFVEKIAKHADQRTKNVFILSALLEALGADYGGVEDVELEKHLDGVMDDDFEALYNLGDETVKALIVRALWLTPGKINDIEQLEFLASKLGFSMAKDYVITKEYLEACTKDELDKLSVELKINMVNCGPKKSDAVDHILKYAPKGKVPKELTK